MLTSSGVTTNSENGVANVEAFYPTFTAMEENDMGMMPLPHSMICGHESYQRQC